MVGLDLILGGRQTTTLGPSMAGLGLGLASGASKALLPLQSRIAFMGDSITFLPGINSFVEWTKFQLGGRYYASEFSNQGINSNTTTQMLARFSGFVAVVPKIAVVFGGTNDLGITSTPAATIISNLRSMYDQLIAINCKVVAMTIMPRNGSSILPAPQEADRVIVNTWIKSQTDITAIDLEAYNPTTQSTGDGLHPNADGALFISNLLTPVLSSRIAAGSIILPAADPSNKVVNPTLAGSNAVSGGNIANNYTLTIPAGAAGLVAASKGTLADGNTAQVFTLSGSGSGVANVTFESDAFTISAVNGDLFEAWCTYELSGGVRGFLGHSFELGGGAIALAFSDLTAGTVVSASQAITKSGVLRSRPLSVSGTVPTTTLKYSFNLDLQSGDIGSNLAGTMKIGNIFVRKVPGGL